MTNHSALLGHPPNTQRDVYILHYLFKGKVPKIAPPPGYVYETRGPGMAAGISVAIFLVFLFTCARLAVRIFHKRMKFGADDWFIIPAALLQIAYLATIIVRVPRSGAGKHLWDVHYEELNGFYTIGNIGQVLFYAGVACTKISITLFNRRLTGISSRPWMMTHYAFLVLLGVWLILAVFMNTFQCSPTIYRFNYFLRGQNPKAYKCWDAAKLANAFAISNAVQDFMLLTVPIIVLWRVKLPIMTKARLMVLFAIGTVSCACAAMRVVAQGYNTFDYTWSFPKTIGWTIGDGVLGVIVASLPALNTLLDVVWPSSWSKRGRTFGSVEKSYGSNSTGDRSVVEATPTTAEGIRRRDEVELGYFPAEDMSKERLPPGQIPESLQADGKKSDVYWSSRVVGKNGSKGSADSV